MNKLEISDNPLSKEGTYFFNRSAAEMERLNRIANETYDHYHKDSEKEAEEYAGAIQLYNGLVSNLRIFLDSQGNVFQNPLKQAVLFGHIVNTGTISDGIRNRDSNEIRNITFHPGLRAVAGQIIPHTITKLYTDTFKDLKYCADFTCYRHQYNDLMGINDDDYDVALVKYGEDGKDGKDGKNEKKLFIGYNLLTGDVYVHQSSLDPYDPFKMRRINGINKENGDSREFLRWKPFYSILSGEELQSVLDRLDAFSITCIDSKKLREIKQTVLDAKNACRQMTGLISAFRDANQQTVQKIQKKVLEKYKKEC